MQKKWIAGGLLVLGLLGMCGCSSQAFVSEQQTETVLTQEETGWEFQDGTYQMEVELLGGKRQGICHFSGKGGDKGRKSSGNAGMEQPQL